MAVAIQNPVLAVDGDAAFLRVNNRKPAAALEPGEVAAAANCRFENGAARPRFGVALDNWGLPELVLTGDTTYLSNPAGGAPYVLITGFVIGSRYIYVSGNSSFLSLGALSSDDGVIPTGDQLLPGVFTATQTSYYLWSGDSESASAVTAQIFQAARTCAYERFSDPTTGLDTGVLLTDDWRDGASEDGGRGRAWRILPGNVPLEIPLNGHDVWDTTRLVQCDTGMLLLRQGNQRYYFDAGAVENGPDRIQLNVTPPWPVGTARRVRFDLGQSSSAIYGSSPPAAGNYYWAKHITGDKVELYTSSSLATILSWEITTNPPTGAFYLEEAQDPPPFFGNAARPLLMQPDENGGSAFNAGFDWVLENVEITDTDATTDIVTAPNHRLQPGDSVTGTVLGGVTWPKFAAPQSKHTLRLYDSADEAMVDGARTMVFTDTDLTANSITSAGHGLVTEDAVLVTGATGATAGTTYFARALTADTISLHPTAADATANTNVVNLTVDDETGTIVALNGMVNLSTSDQTGALWKTSAASVPLPPCREGAFINGRFIGIAQQDLVVISDPLDPLHCTIWNQVIPANQGEAGRANWLRALGDNLVAVGKDLNVIGLAGLNGPSSGWSERIITAEYNGLAPLAAFAVGTDLWFAARKGLASIIRTVAGETLGTARTVSHDVPDYLKDIDWSNARLMCAATWNNRVFWAMPLRGQVAGSVVNNQVLVLNRNNNHLRVQQQDLAGDLAGGITEVNGLVESWEGAWNGELLTPYNFVRLNIGGEERLTFATADGIVCWLHDGWDDFGQDIECELLTRGYFGGRPVLALKGKLNWDTYQPKITASIKTAGVNEEETLTGFDELEYDRTKYLTAGTTDYDPDTATETDFNRAHREDYSPADTDLSVALLDVHQNITEPFRCRARGVAPQLRIINEQGSLRLGSVTLQAKPVGVNAKRET